MVSQVFRSAAYGQQTDECPIVLLEIDHADLAAPIRVTSDAVDTVHLGNTYMAFPFAIAFPDDTDDVPPTSRLIIDNVDRQVVQAIRNITSSPDVTMWMVLASDPDTIEAGPFAMTMESAEYNALTVSGNLAYEDDLNTAYPKDAFTPDKFQALF